VLVAAGPAEGAEGSGAAALGVWAIATVATENALATINRANLLIIWLVWTP
jgi:hypothetical protein